MDKITDEFQLARQKLAKDIVGEVVLSEDFDKVIRKWRSIFKISQKRLSEELKITSSVVSDYESGRRKSPGIKMIKKYVNAMLDIDQANGGHVIRSFGRSFDEPVLSSAILDIREFSSGIRISEFCEKINSLPTNVFIDQDIYGYTIIDSVKAITELSFTDLVKLYGITTQRALIFTQVSTGRTPMVAIKLTNLKPKLVVFHGLSEVDEIAKRIATVENIPLCICKLNNVDEIISRLNDIK